MSPPHAAGDGRQDAALQSEPAEKENATADVSAPTAGSRPFCTAALKLAFGTALAGLALLLTYSQSREEFPVVELRDIALWGAAVNTVLMAAALVLLRSRACNAVLATILLASAGSAYLIHTDLYLTGNRMVFGLGALAIWAGLFSVFGLIDDNRSMGTGIVAAALLALAVTTGLQVREQSRSAQDRAESRNYAAELRPITFDSTPNLYFVSFDALAPQALLQEYMGIETTDLLDLLNEEFRGFPNMFTDSIFTRHSLNTLLSLDPEFYWSKRLEVGGDPQYPTGHSPNPLFDILEDQGYETAFIFPSGYFGVAKGAHLDNLVLGQTRAVCDFLDPSIAKAAFWGYCNLPLENYSSDGWVGDRHGYQAQVDAIFDRSTESGPQFVLTNFLLPLHTDRHFDNDNSAHLDDYRDQYLSNSRQAAGLLAQLLEQLDAHDPDGILFVFGDHGMNLTNTMTFDDDPEFVVKDRYGIFGGIYPRDACEPWFDETLSQHSYLTTLDAVHTILRCLSGGEEVLVEPRSRLIRNGYGSFPNDDVERSFAEYLYE